MSKTRLVYLTAFVILLVMTFIPAGTVDAGICVLECQWEVTPLDCLGKRCSCDAEGGATVFCYECSDNDYTCPIQQFSEMDPLEDAERELFGADAVEPVEPARCPESAESVRVPVD